MNGLTLTRCELRFGVVVNPRSAGGRGARAARKVLRALAREGIAATVLTGTDAADCKARLRAACESGSVDALIIVGGDGIIGLVIQVAAARALPIGIVPAGSGNDFARQFALSHRPSAAVARIVAAASAPRKVDLGVAVLPDGREHFFAGGLSLGFDAAINRRANGYRIPLGPLRYHVALMQELVWLKSRPFTVTLHGEARSFTGLLATVMNTRAIGGGIPLAPRASVEDGFLDLVEVSHGSKLRVLSVLGLLARGRHESLREVTITRVQEVRIEAGAAASDEIAYADGERVGPSPFVVRIAPRALSLLA